MRLEFRTISPNRTLIRRRMPRMPCDVQTAPQVKVEFNLPEAGGAVFRREIV